MDCFTILFSNQMILLESTRNSEVLRIKGFPVSSHFGDPEIAISGALRAPDRAFPYRIFDSRQFWGTKIVKLPGAIRAPDCYILILIN